VNTTPSLAIEEHDWQEINLEEREQRVRLYGHDDRRRGFELGAEPHWRLALFLMNRGDHRSAWTSHHALFVGYSRLRGSSRSSFPPTRRSAAARNHGASQRTPTAITSSGSERTTLPRQTFSGGAACVASPHLRRWSRTPPLMLIRRRMTALRRGPFDSRSTRPRHCRVWRAHTG